MAGRRGDASHLGYAVQLALLHHPGTTLANLGQPVDALMAWMARQLEIRAEAFAHYARRPQTVTDHARELAAALGLHPATKADLPLMVGPRRRRQGARTQARRSRPPSSRRCGAPALSSRPSR